MTPSPADTPAASWWRLYAHRSHSYYGCRRHYASAASLDALADLKQWFVSHGFTVVCVRG